MLGKYRSLESAVDLCRAIDILKNKRLYLSEVSSLNDPLEGLGLRIPIPGHAGISMSTNSDQIAKPVRESLGRFKVLCLTSDCRNTQMWAHYADDFRGMCVCLRETGQFAEARAMEYLGRAEGVESSEACEIPSEIDEAIRRSLLIKQEGWAYEKEHRVIRSQANSELGSYFDFKADDIIAVIIGHRVYDEVRSMMRGMCSLLEIPLYTTLIKELSNQVEIVPDGFRIRRDGTKLDDQLNQYYENNPIPRFSELENW